MTDADYNMIAIPRPAPDEVMLATCGADGAVAWMKVSKAVLLDASFREQVAPLLAFEQEQLRQKGKPVPA